MNSQNQHLSFEHQCDIKSATVIAILRTLNSSGIAFSWTIIYLFYLFISYIYLCFKLFICLFMYYLFIYGFVKNNVSSIHSNRKE
jgi:hypothetical protein